MFERANHLIEEHPGQNELPKSMWFHMFLGNDVGETLSYTHSPVEFPYLEPSFITVHLLRKLRHVTTKFKVLISGLDRSIHWTPGHIFAINEFFWTRHKSKFFAAITNEFAKLREQYDGKIVIGMIPPKELCLEGQHWDTMVGEFRDYFEQYEGVDVASYGSVRECPQFFANYFKLDTHFSSTGHRDYFQKVIKPRLRNVLKKSSAVAAKP